MKKEILTKVQAGFKGRFPKYRLAWSDSPGEWDPASRANAAYYRLKSEGRAGIEYFRASAKEIANR